MAHQTVERPNFPLFELFTIDELHKRLGHSMEYLLALKSGRKPIGRRFRLTAAGILNRPEAELFDHATTESEQRAISVAEEG